jgi:hypothetical protein
MRHHRRDPPVQERLTIGSVRCLERTVSGENRGQSAWRLLGNMKRHRDGGVEVLGKSTHELHESVHRTSGCAHDNHVAPIHDVRHRQKPATITKLSW